MKLKILGLLAVGLLAGPMAATSASAAMIQWNASGTFASGATANGTAVWNTTTNLFDSWSIVVSGDSSFSAATYSNTVLGSSQSVSAIQLVFNGKTPGNGVLTFVLGSGAGDLTALLDNPASAIQFLAIGECGSSCVTQRRGTVASFTGGQDVTPAPVPEPGTLALLGLGLAGLGLSRRRKAA